MSMFGGDKPKEPAPADPLRDERTGLCVGQLVRHKVDGRLMVITDLYDDDKTCEVSLSSKEGDMLDVLLAEVEDATGAPRSCQHCGQPILNGALNGQPMPFLSGTTVVTK